MKPKRPLSSVISSRTDSGTQEPFALRSSSVLGHIAQPAATVGYEVRRLNLDPKQKTSILRSGASSKPFWSKASNNGSGTLLVAGKDESQKNVAGSSSTNDSTIAPGISYEALKKSSPLGNDQKTSLSLPFVKESFKNQGKLKNLHFDNNPGGIRIATMLFGAEKQIINNPLLDGVGGQATISGGGKSSHQNIAVVQDISSISLAELCMLQQAFQKADGDGNGALDPNEFINAFMPFFSNPGDVSRLFMRIDADCDGVVSWEEFLSFVISQDDAKMSIESEYSRREFEYPSTQESSQSGGHREQACGLVFLSDADRYISFDSKGELLIWKAEESDETAKLHRPKDFRTDLPFITGIIHIHRFFNFDRLALFSAEKQLTFVDVMRESCKQSGIVKLEISPHCANSVILRNDAGELIEQEALAFGDDRGSIHLFRAHDLHKCAEINMRVPDERSANEAHIRSWCAHDKSAFVYKIEYCSDIKLLISCGSDGQLVLSDVIKGAIKIDGLRHRSDVHDFVWLPKVQQLASCGIERHINVWQVGIKTPVDKLEGHKTSVQRLLLGGGQLFSMDVSKILIIWDITEMLSIQKLDGSKVHPDFPIGGMAYDYKRNILATVARGTSLWKVADRKVPNGHVHPITCAVFNPIFEMVITADESSEIRIWDLNAGSVIFCFSNAHVNEKGENVKISAMTLDNSFRRLITGAHNGSAKIWNFSTGQCLAILDGFGDGEISAMTVMSMKPYEYIVACGWNRQVTFWMDPHVHQSSRGSELQAGTFAHCFHFNGHKDDILSMACHHATNLLITGSFDGDIIIWKAECGSVRTRLVLPGILSMRGDQKPIEAIEVIDCGTRQHSGSNEIEVILLIVTIGGDDCIRIWSSDSAAELLLEVKRIVDNDDKNMDGAGDIGLVGLSACQRNKVMVIADTKGYLCVYDITRMIESSHLALAPRNEELEPPERRCKFHAHVGYIRCVKYINTRHLILTSSQDCNISLWTIFGEKIGTFGEQADWTLMKQMHRYENLLDIAAFGTPISTTGRSTRHKTLSEKRGFNGGNSQRTDKKVDPKSSALKRRQSLKDRISSLQVSDNSSAKRAQPSPVQIVTPNITEEDLVSVFLTGDGAIYNNVNDTAAETKQTTDEVEEKIQEEDNPSGSDISTDSEVLETEPEEKDVTYQLRENIDEILLRGLSMKERGEKFFESGQPVIPAYQKIKIGEISEVQLPEQVAKRLSQIKASSKKSNLVAFAGVRRRAEPTTQ